MMARALITLIAILGKWFEMEFDQETHDKIIIMAKDIKYIRERLGEGKETFKDHKEIFKKHAKRIRDLESNQQLLTGKMTLIVMGIGALMLFVANFIRELVFK